MSVRTRVGRSFRWFTLVGLIIILSARGEGVSHYPEVADDRLQITLYAEDPSIVTPIGGAVDAGGRLFVIESHTHSPPPDYDGPKRDLIKIFEGTRPDGTAEKVTVFADDLFQAQSLAFDAHGTLYVVCTRAVIALHDHDGDGVADDSTRILTIDPYEHRGNPHGQLQGIAFSADGWMYVGRGAHMKGEFEWRAADGTRLPALLGNGIYDGGEIIRVRPDGTQLERIATGFWNPFALAFDRRGRLLAVDNDPDARGPNRLLHIVPGGDYGYVKTYGRFGLHPYQAWEGEIPGTLPMIQGVGEAPTGVLDANTARLPADYRDAVLVAAWTEHHISLHRTEEVGSSVRADREILIQGGDDESPGAPFRPSGMSVSPDGTIYIMDWMLIDYTTHQRGRIWKVTPKEGVSTTMPRPLITSFEPTPAVQRLTAIYELTESDDYAALRTALTDSDPFVRNAAVVMLAGPVFRSEVMDDLDHPQEMVRLGALLALRKAGVPNPESIIKPRLYDSSAAVVGVAMIWSGEKVLRSLQPDVDQVPTSLPDLDNQLFETWLATMQILNHEGLEELYARRVAPALIHRELEPEFISALIHDPRRPAQLRSLALRRLTSQDVNDPANHALLLQLAQAGEPLLQVEAIRRLQSSSLPETVTVLRAIAFDDQKDTDIRAEALLSLSTNPDVSLLELLDDPEPTLQVEVVRITRGLASRPTVRALLRAKLSVIQGDPLQVRLASQLEFVLAAETVPRPTTVSAWQDRLATGGDIDAGRRVFFSAHAACNTCHVSEGRGGMGGNAFTTMPFGPDLSVIGRVADRKQLIDAIVAPSNSMAPEMQGWIVNLHSGESIVGRQIDQADRHIQLILMDGKEYDIPREKIASWGAMTTSLMPPGLDAGMAVEEFRDLVAYLESLQ